MKVSVSIYESPILGKEVMTSETRVVILTPTLLYIHRNSICYALNKKLGGTQSKLANFAEKTNICSLLEFEPQIVRPVA
jgi:hypothetical protein